MTGLPLWAYPLASVAGCCLLLAALLWWGERPRGIDMTRLTDDGLSFDEHADQAVDVVWEPRSHLLGGDER